ncbi:4-aminobutyrate--2-oxoglutarate transaminase [Evansella sp. LMS18]|uniref:4-aminobutyrate--2-oxoglutarate transaminase n=1 Tax=Evansella sp. LMS18 TaxID=2924033 RepID=UPI0020D1695E|nr:4-aminobutyrate--2-oxoglutarate transaminase [Evansella sp. LMS18]UTR11767.1 4-aminobutyrate--2-oxoglutarate transaminase [Evansella sp. LMS18]
MANQQQTITNIPGPKSSSLHERRKKAVPRGPVNLTEIYAEFAEGAKVIDVDGNEYIDFAGGIGVQNIGHSHPKVMKAIEQQTKKFVHTCFHVAPYEGYVELAERLNALTPGSFEKKTLLLNSGAEAVENSIKIARKYSGKHGIISFNRGFHGRTLLAMSLTSKVKPYKHGFGPFASSTYKAPFPYYYRTDDRLSRQDIDEQILTEFRNFFISEVAADEIAAVIMEPVQGEGGFIVPSKYFVQGIKQICEENNILFIADEIQTGFCRTGKLFASEHFGIDPDIITMSKSLAAGMPLSAVTGRAEVMDAPEPAQLGGTLGGSPFSCAAALAVLEVIEDEQLVARSAQLGEKMNKVFAQWQEKYSFIGDVRGVGPMCALELVKDRDTKEPAKELTAAITDYCWKNGLIALSAGLYGNVLRFLPPVTITDEQLEKGLSILEDAFAASVD